MRRLQGEGHQVAVVVTSDRVDLDKLNGLTVRVMGQHLEASEVIV